MVIDSSSNVGIGTTGPIYKLVVAKDGGTIASFQDTTNSNGVQLTGYSGHIDIKGYADTADAWVDLGIRSSASTQLYLKTDGNVGIGTDSPDAKLDVEGGDIKVTYNSGYNLQLSDSGGNGKIYANGDSSSLAFGATAALGSTATERMRIDGVTGNVGIGTTNPGRELEVVGVIKANGTFISTASSSSTNLATGNGGQLSLFNGNSTDGNFSNIGGYNSNSLVTSQICFINESHTSRTGAIAFLTHNGGSMPERMRISSAGAIKFNAYGAGTLVTDASGNITASSGGGAGGPFLPLAGGTMTGTSGIEIPEDFALKWKGTSTSTVVFEINNSGGTTTIQAGDGTNSHKFKIAVGDGGMEINPIGGGSIADFMSNKINLNQNVGIGVGSPDVPLDVTASETGNGFSDGIVRFENTTSVTSGGATVVNIRNNYQGGFGTLIKFFRTSTSTSIANISFNSGGTAVNYNTGSDYRLKEDLQTFNGFDIIDNISVYNYKWKGVDFRGYGVLAHELNSVFPDAVTGEKDAEEMQSVDYSKLVPVLIKSIQELKIEIETIKQQLNN